MGNRRLCSRRKYSSPILSVWLLHFLICGTAADSFFFRNKIFQPCQIAHLSNQPKKTPRWLRLRATEANQGRPLATTSCLRAVPSDTPVTFRCSPRVSVILVNDLQGGCIRRSFPAIFDLPIQKTHAVNWRRTKKIPPSLSDDARQEAPSPSPFFKHK